MSKTTALTFTAAAALMALCITLSIHGRRVAERQIHAEEDYFIMTEFGARLDSWERVANVIGLLALSVSFAGAVLWHGELYPPPQRVSILGLEENAGRRIFRASIPGKSVTAAEINVDENRARPREEESLSPLERVIRGY